MVWAFVRSFVYAQAALCRGAGALETPHFRGSLPRQTIVSFNGLGAGAPRGLGDADRPDLGRRARLCTALARGRFDALFAGACGGWVGVPVGGRCPAAAGKSVRVVAAVVADAVTVRGWLPDDGFVQRSEGGRRGRGCFVGSGTGGVIWMTLGTVVSQQDLSPVPRARERRDGYPHSAIDNTSRTRSACREM